MYEVLIQGATVYDGTGNPGRVADVGVEGGYIVAVGVLDTAGAREVIDARGLVLMPGFIDTHCHEDVYLLHNRQHVMSLSQGVTTLITGPDGLSYAPLSRHNLVDYSRYLQGLNGPLDEGLADFTTVAGYLKKFDRTGPNACVQVPHGALRLETVGFHDVPLRGYFLDRAKDLMRQGFAEGAVGFSTGLSYYPCSYADTEELVELCKVAAEWDAPFSIHLRTVYRGERFDPVAEAIEIARRSGCRLHFSHYRTGPHNVGQVEAVCAPIEAALAEGIRVTVEMYPFHTGSGYGVYFMPPWAVEGGWQAACDRLHHAASRQQIIDWMRAHMRFADDDTFTHLPRNPQYIGRGFGVVARERGQDIPQMLCELLAEENLEVGYRGGDIDDPALHEALHRDFAKLLSKPYYMVGSDGIACHAFPHPRAYGAFAKFLRIARENGLPWETFANRTSYLPAKTFGLKDRGEIAPGKLADIVVLDGATARENATFANPIQLPTGIEYVLVNGKVALRGGRVNGVLAGHGVAYSRER